MTPATYFSITRDKANLAPVGERVWRRMASVQLANGDSVGVAEVWEWPDTFDGVTVDDLLSVQRALDGKQLRYSDQAATIGPVSPWPRCWAWTPRRTASASRR